MAKAIPSDRHVTYQVQSRRCGKRNCRICREGGRHGLYVYGYWREAGRLRSAYVGKWAGEGVTALPRRNPTEGAA